MSKKTKRIQNKNDYEKSSFKDVIEDMEDTKNEALESLPKIKKRTSSNWRGNLKKRYYMAMMTIRNK